MATIKKDYLSARELGTDYFITETRRILVNKESQSYKFKGLKSSARWDRNETIYVRVAPQNIAPALALMKAFIDYGLEHGHDIIVKYGLTRVIIKGQEDEIS